ncbi:NAD(P)/FAD-dependent oxidoreductase [Campylobacter sp. RM16187]|uniref:NAD(P)/FAD-dependent oxidoreductase n=1 Tax=Campylobacter sp. RM16187 TaxID=1660063 RepID=UPI0021B64001|nr:FAD/NAD(P)-binding oxidoreductase [Campylobacter sp. RM16187]QKG29532.1 putative NADH dehydrogenase [Campylobacter sp. RM16187]
MDSNKIIDEVLEELEKEGHKISRRDAMKLIAMSPVAAGVFANTVAPTNAEASSATGKIVIVGGGLSGIATAAKLCKKLKNPDVTIVEPNPISVSYQAGQTLIAAGVYKKDDIIYQTKDYMPKDAKWIQKAAKNFDPDNNKVILEDGSEVLYDYLVVAMGVTLNYGAIEGLEGEITTLGNSDVVRKKIGKNGVYSLYFADGSVDTYEGIQDIIKQAKEIKGGEKLQLIFTDSPTAIKCGGAPKKIMYIAHDLIKKAGVRDKVEMLFYTNSDKLFSVPEYAEAIEKQYKERDFKWDFKTRLVAVDTENRVATLEKTWMEKGEWDKDLEEYEMIKKTERITKKFDFLHIVPPQKAPDAVGKSPLGSPASWVPAHKETLQHIKYPNVFVIGDCAAVPLGKTGGSARKQYHVVVDNLIAVMEKKDKLPAAYDGYTVCPFITSIGTVMFAEFDWSGKPAPSFPLDPTQERWLMWLLKVYLMKPMIYHGMLPGRI